MENRKNDSTYKAQAKVSFLGFLSELPNFVAVLVTALISTSLIMWIDLVCSFCNILRTGFASLISLKMDKQQKTMSPILFKKKELKIGFLIDVLVVIGLILLMVVSINEIITPQAVKETLVWAIGLKVINVAVDSFILYRQVKLMKKAKTPVVRSEFNAYLMALLFDAVVLVSVVICFILRNDSVSSYLQPSLCIGIGVFVFVQTLIEFIRKLKEWGAL